MQTSTVVDASVLVSAFLLPGSVPGRVVESDHQGKFALPDHRPATRGPHFRARRGRDVPHVLPRSPLLLDETRYALLSTRLRDSYGHGDEAVVAWRADLEGIARLFAEQLPDIGLICRDPNDNHVIAVAVVRSVAVRVALICPLS